MPNSHFLKKMSDDNHEISSNSSDKSNFADFVEENVNSFSPEEFGMAMSLIQDRDEDILKLSKTQDKKKILPIQTLVKTKLNEKM